ncbi:unnamed protein product [Brachionus calyciflorus]|uniref:Uncharacterized protein n=1 Tax=Brachionus calyciflorus TaxID=104777 RepID=A0A814AFL6_9BILA|nr:unnamed protein product [Brachionus calyciflorus]
MLYTRTNDSLLSLKIGTDILSVLPNDSLKMLESARATKEAWKNLQSEREENGSDNKWFEGNLNPLINKIVDLKMDEKDLVQKLLENMFEEIPRLMLKTAIESEKVLGLNLKVKIGKLSKVEAKSEEIDFLNNENRFLYENLKYE